MLPCEDQLVMDQKISIAEDFTKYPSGRYRRNGPGSGEEFREKFLLPALRAGRHVWVAFGGAYGYPASFVEEAFGGLIRSGQQLEHLERNLTLEPGAAEYEVYVAQAWRFMREASRAA